MFNKITKVCIWKCDAVQINNYEQKLVFSSTVVEKKNKIK